MASDIYVATESFVAEVDGETVQVTRDLTRVREGHPLLRGRKGLFKRLDVHYDVERTTARPGERRQGPAAGKGAGRKPASKKGQPAAGKGA